MPKSQRPKLRLHRDTVRRLDTPAAGLLLTDPVQYPGDTALCGPSRMGTCETV